MPSRVQCATSAAALVLVLLLALSAPPVAALDFGVRPAYTTDGICPSPTGRAACSLRRSAPGELLRLERSDTAAPDAPAVPVARSYDGHDWEGVNPSPLAVACSAGGGCTFNYDAPRYSYKLWRTTVTANKHAATAKLFAQGSFGAQITDIKTFDARGGADAGAAGAWFDTQVAPSPALLRMRVRQRMNPRVTDDKAYPVYAPCDVGARWHRHAFTARDLNEEVVVAERQGRKTLTLAGEVVTEVPTDALQKGAGTYYVCGVEERVGGDLQLANNRACTNGRTDEVNPAIEFSSPPRGMEVWEPAGGDMKIEPTVMSSEVGTTTAVKAGVVCPPRTGRVYFVRYNGAYWRYDRRMKYVLNTPEAPTTLDAYETTYGMVCPAVPMSPLNEDTCVAGSPCGAGGLTCGSRAEVANEPVHGNFYATFQEGSTVETKQNLADLDYTVKNHHHLKRFMLHSAAVYGPADQQLRYRIAWALYQMIPVSEEIGHEEQSESWAAYMDIFVANAFGNYRDILREVSYSAVMAEFLSFIDNKGFAASGALPDQNYAREIMQLFSIGLSMLKRDGSKVYVNGKDVPTYDTQDIVSLSRAWTGFTYGGVRRSNGEWKLRKELIDPMVVNGGDRDAFPKTDTRGGYVGDGYPLCGDLPGRHFLMAGARYVYTGSGAKGSLEDAYAARPGEQASEELLPDAPALVVDGACEYDPRSFFKVPVAGGLADDPTSVNPVEAYIHGDNGNVMRVGGVRRAVANGNFQFNALFSPTPGAEVCAEFDRLFPTGTTITVHNTPTIGTPMKLLAQFTPESSSPLFAALCGAKGARACTFPPLVTLEQDLTCGGDAVCAQLEDVTSVKVVDGGVAHYYAYVRPACVKLAVFEGRQVLEKRGAVSDVVNIAQCADPTIPLAGAACCVAVGNSDRTRQSYAPPQCAVLGERMTHATARARCEAQGLSLCKAFDDKSRLDWTDSCAYRQYQWTANACSMQVQVDDDGAVHLITPGLAMDARLQPGTLNTFYPRWAQNGFPDAAAVAAGETDCELAAAGTVLCSVATRSEAVFTQLPERDNAEAVLHIGAPPPSAYGPGEYVCAAGVDCASADVVMYTRGGAVDKTTIIGLKVPAARGGGYKYHMNRRETVLVGSMHAFRNPPNFMPLAGEKVGVRVAEQEELAALAADHAARSETEALLDHLFHHPNTAPFVSHLLIQRLVTSNPSPRYIEAVATAFTEGTYKGRGSGRYGCMTATVAAILLDREARSSTLDADPGHGAVREPFLKVLQVMRSEGLAVSPGAELRLDTVATGQDAFMSPSVFGFYLPSYRPAGPLDERGLVAPEMQLAVVPRMYVLQNGLSRLMRRGLTEDGFGSEGTGAQGRLAGGAYGAGYPDDAMVRAMIADLDLTLCQGRLADASRDILLEEVPKYTLPVTAANDPMACPPGYTHQDRCATTGDRCVSDADGKTWVAPATCGKGKQGASYPEDAPDGVCCYVPDAARARADMLNTLRELIVVTDEFHASNIAVAVGTPRDPPTGSAAHAGQTYKAVVAYMLQGGADSWNFLIPSDCGGGDVSYATYKQRRGVVAIPEGQLAGSRIRPQQGHAQPCSEFYMSYNLTEVAKMFAEGDAAVFPNVGNLIHQFTRAEKGTAELPPHRFAHNFAQRHAQNMHCQAGPDAKGVLGRMADALDAQGVTTNLYGIGDFPTIIRANNVQATVLDLDEGAKLLDVHARYPSAVERLLAERKTSYFADTYGSELLNSIGASVDMRAKLAAAAVSSPGTAVFADDVVGEQFKLISTIMRLRNDDAGQTRLADRDMFVVTKTRYDTHNQAWEAHTKMLDDALRAFKVEMVAQGIWRDVVVVTLSDFGRTFTSNGRGTDHAWGGNYFAVGGAIRDQVMLSTFPTSFASGHDYDWGNGIMIPAWGYEVFWGPVADWVGVEEARWGDVLPNLHRFPATCRHDLFESDSGQDEVCATPPPTPAPPTTAPTPSPDVVPAVPLGAYEEKCAYIPFPEETPLAAFGYSMGLVDGEAAVLFRATLAEGAWGAVGLRPRTTDAHAMEGLDIVAWDTTGALHDYEESVGPLAPERSVFTRTAVRSAGADAGGAYTVEFYRLLRNGVDFTIATDAEVNVAVAVGEGTISDYWPKHTQRFKKNYKFESCSELYSTAAPPATPLPPTPSPSTPSPVSTPEPTAPSGPAFDALCPAVELTIGGTVTRAAFTLGTIADGAERVAGIEWTLEIGSSDFWVGVGVAPAGTGSMAGYDTLVLDSTSTNSLIENDVATGYGKPAATMPRPGTAWVAEHTIGAASTVRMYTSALGGLATPLSDGADVAMGVVAGSGSAAGAARHDSSLKSSVLVEYCSALKEVLATPVPPSTPGPSTPKPAVATPAPVAVTPAPVAVTPAPVVATPAPVVATPAPVVATPVPVVATPAPTVSTPTPAVATPTPTVATPAPVVATPAPTDATPAPIVSTPAPVAATPAPTDATPAPAVSTPTPAVATPTPTVATPAPIVSTPAPVVATPAPMVATPVPVVATLAPVMVTPAPVIPTPGPAVATPKPVAVTLVPAVVTPAPIVNTLAPAVTSAPVLATPAPVATDGPAVVTVGPTATPAPTEDRVSLEPATPAPGASNSITPEPGTAGPTPGGRVTGAPESDAREALVGGAGEDDDGSSSFPWWAVLLIVATLLAVCGAVACAVWKRQTKPKLFVDDLNFDDPYVDLKDVSPAPVPSVAMTQMLAPEAPTPLASPPPPPLQSPPSRMGSLGAAPEGQPARAIPRVYCL